MTYDLTGAPTRIRKLRTDRHGRPVPWFVAWINGQPDFRVIGHNRIPDAVRFSKCWVCGGPLGAHLAFTIGPMCAVNRVSAEPPSHRDCAVYSATHCPFLTTPNMVRRDRHLPDDTEQPAGVMLARNPGVTLVWNTKNYTIERHDGGVLFRIGQPTSTEWYAEGRPATRAEVLASIDSGLPTLQEMADAEGHQARAELDRMHADALRYVPA